MFATPICIFFWFFIVYWFLYLLIVFILFFWDYTAAGGCKALPSGIDQREGFFQPKEAGIGGKTREMLLLQKTRFSLVVVSFLAFCFFCFFHLRCSSLFFHLFKKEQGRWWSGFPCRQESQVFCLKCCILFGMLLWFSGLHPFVILVLFLSLIYCWTTTTRLSSSFFSNRGKYFSERFTWKLLQNYYFR